MAVTYNKLVIDVNDPTINDIVSIKQGDADSRYLDVALYSSGSPIDLTGNSVKIYFLKPDSTAVYTEGEITDAPAGRCQFLMSGQTLAVAGTLKAEITIYDGTTEILSTQTFNFYILPSIRDDDAPPSTNEFGVLVTLFQNIQNVMTTINDVLSGFDSLQDSTDAAKVSADGAKTAAESYGTTINNKIGNSGDPTTTTMFGKQNAIRTEISSLYTYISGKSFVKSSQRGIFSVGGTGTLTIAISSVDISKSFVLINDSASSLPDGNAGAFLYSMTSTSITINVNVATAGCYGSWQVIELN